MPRCSSRKQVKRSCVEWQTEEQWGKPVISGPSHTKIKIIYTTLMSSRTKHDVVWETKNDCSMKWTVTVQSTTVATSRGFAHAAFFRKNSFLPFHTQWILRETFWCILSVLSTHQGIYEHTPVSVASRASASCQIWQNHDKTHATHLWGQEVKGSVTNKSRVKKMYPEND